MVMMHEVTDLSFHESSSSEAPDPFEYMVDGLPGTVSACGPMSLWIQMTSRRMSSWPFGCTWLGGVLIDYSTLYHNQ